MKSETCVFNYCQFSLFIFYGYAELLKKYITRTYVFNYDVFIQRGILLLKLLYLGYML